MRRVSTMLLLASLGCGSDETGVEVTLPSTDTAMCVALGADYTNNVGTMAVIGLPSLTVIEDVLPAAISGDPVLRAHGDRLYVVNRTANNVTVVDHTTRRWTVESQFSTGPNSFPQDIALAVAGARAYVTLYNKAELQVWDLLRKNPAAPVVTVDLSGYDEDGVPNANSVVVAGGRAYVTLDLLDTQMFPQPRGKGKVVVVDTATNQIVTDMTLVYENPYDFMFQRGETLIVSTFADFSGTRGCLEQIRFGASPEVMPCLVENSALGGTINSIAVAPDDTFLAVSTFGPPPEYEATGQLRRLDAAGHLVGASLTPETQNPTDVAYAPSGHLVYADRAGGGIRVHDLAAGRELTTAALDIGLAPVYANAIVCLER